MTSNVQYSAEDRGQIGVDLQITRAGRRRRLPGSPT